MITPPAAAAAATPSVSVAPLATTVHETTFSDVLSALNPLQYLPGVGTIYRAITGDSPSEPVRVVGSIIVGGLLGGPIGAAISAVSSLVQHISGIDLDHVAHDMMAGMGLVSDVPTGSTAAAAPALISIAPTAAHSATAAEAPVAVWRMTPEPDPEVPSPIQLRAALAAYGQSLAPSSQRLGHV
jgi:hypothetical protein